MVSILKNWMGIKKDDNLKDIPEIQLHKKEPKFYFDEKLKRWVIEGEEIEPEKAKKPPPKKGLNKSDKNDNNKSKSKTKSKYANAFGDENIYTPETKPEINSNNENEVNNNINNDINKPNNLEEKKDEINIEEDKIEENNQKPEINEINDINNINNPIKEKENENV